MGWVEELFDPANLLALLGVVVTVGVMSYERLIPGRKRIGFRVQMDTVIDDGDQDDSTLHQRLALLESNPDLAGASLVLLRIENDGFRGIDSGDYFTAPQQSHGLTVVFRDRTVHDVAVTEPSHLSLLHYLPRHGPADGSQAPAGADPDNPGVVWEGSEIRLPRVPMNPGDHFKLLVLLTGPGGGNARILGRIREGRIRDNEKFRKPSNRMLGLIGALFALVVAQPFAFQLLQDEPLPQNCATGTLSVGGSTAFQPVMKKIGDAYAASCQGRPVIETSASKGSEYGVGDLGKQGDGALDIAVSDGRSETSDPQLRAHLIAVSVFVLVAHNDVPVDRVSSVDVRKLFAGKITDWNGLAPRTGAAPHQVVVVGRDSGSGSRRAFENRVLLTGQAQTTSRPNSCTKHNHHGEKRLLCEQRGTPELLDTVARTPGAIGYAEVDQAVEFAEQGRLKVLGLDGAVPPDRAALKSGVHPFVDQVRQGTYPFWAGEYAYTYARPDAQPNSLSDWFLDYLTTESSAGIIERHGALPCSAHPGQHTDNQAACDRALKADEDA